MAAFMLEFQGLLLDYYFLKIQFLKSPVEQGDCNYFICQVRDQNSGNQSSLCK